MASERVELFFDPVLGKFDFKKVEGKAKKAGKKAGVNFAKGFQKAMPVVVKAAAVAATAIAGIGFALKGATSASAEVEQIQVRLAGLTGSAEAAGLVLRDLRKFAAETPFQLTDIANAATKLIAFGVSAGEVQERIREIGDAAAGSGSDLGELSRIYGQVGAAGRLTGERLLQLEERAIPIGPAIAKTMGIAESSVRDLVRQGKITREIFAESFRSMSREGGVFANALQTQSKTVSGILSTLRDNLFDVGVTLGDTFKDSVITSAEVLIGSLQTFSKIIVANGPTIQSTMAGIADTLLITPVKFWTDFFSSKSSTSVSRLNDEIKQTEERLAGAQKRLNMSGKESGIAGFFSGLLGEKDAALADFNEIKLKLIDLEQTKMKLTKVSTDEKKIRDQLAEQAAAKREAQETARLQRQKDTALQLLGATGLEKEQILLQQHQKQQSLIDEAFLTGAIKAEEAAERTFQIEAVLQQKISALKTNANNGGFESLTDKIGGVREELKNLAKDYEVTSKQIAKASVDTLGKGVGQGFAAVGAALVNGENALEAFGKAFLAAIGQTLVSLGTRFILEGIAVSLSPFTAGAGGPLIAAGAAMTLAGGAMGAISGGAAGGGSGGGVGAAAASGADTDTETESLAAAPLERTTETGITLNIAGDFLDSDEGGLKIVESIQKAFDTQGVVLRTNVA